MLLRLSQEELKKIVLMPVAGITDHDRDEMAIPSYLHANPLIRWLMWKRYQKIAELASLHKSMSVLEFGCGIGLFLPTLVNLCAKVYAMDLFPDYAQRLAETFHLKVDFIKDMAAATEVHVDCIIAADVLEHLDDPSSYLVQFREMLKPDGKLIVSGPTENLLYRVGRLIAGFSGKGDYHHTNIDLLVPLIVSAGFEPTSCIRLPFCFPPALFKICSFRRLD